MMSSDSGLSTTLAAAAAAAALNNGINKFPWSLEWEDEIDTYKYNWAGNIVALESLIVNV